MDVSTPFRGHSGSVIFRVSHIADHGRICWNGWIVGYHRTHHSINWFVGTKCIRRIYNSKHSLATMGRYSTVEIQWICVIDNLGENKAFTLSTRGKWRVLSGIARTETRRLRDCVCICTPYEFDSITDWCIDSKRNIAKNALRRSNYDSVDCSSAGWTTTTWCIHCWRGDIGRRTWPILCNTLVNTVVIAGSRPRSTPWTIHGSGAAVLCRRRIRWRRHGGCTTIHRRAPSVARLGLLCRWARVCTTRLRGGGTTPSRITRRLGRLRATKIDVAISGDKSRKQCHSADQSCKTNHFEHNKARNVRWWSRCYCQRASLRVC